MVCENVKIYFQNIHKIDLTKKCVRRIEKQKKRRMGNLEDSVVDTQAEDNIDRFMYIVKTRLTDHFKQDWYWYDIITLKKCCSYCIFTYPVV